LSELYKTNTLAEGTYTNVFVSNDGSNLVKVIKNPANNGLLAAEAEIVGKLKETNLADLFPDLVEQTEVTRNISDNSRTWYRDDTL